MCRWLAYVGSPIFMDALLFKPEHSLVYQSQHAQRTIYQTNGDGFGLGWYLDKSEAGVYRSVRPAWNDRNLRSLSQQIASSLFLAHVRATTGTAIQQSNCHPFRYENWLFQHNGEVNEFEKLKRDIDLSIDPELYPLMEGSTDTERLFYLALSYGLQKDPIRALKKMVGRIEELREKRGVQQPFRITAVTTDGKSLYAIRYASNTNSPTLFHSLSTLHAIRDISGQTEELPGKGILVLSEPLDEVSEHWEEVKDAKILVVEDGEISEEDFEPIFS